jgi:glycosyltransferase involved in cell wall biosynthesis
MTDAAKLPISACIVARDEEDRLGDCLASVEFCDDVVVVDSHSSDGTRELAAARGARVFERDWPGFGPQKEFAVGEARNDRVLILDADERVSDELRDELRALGMDGIEARAGWEIPRLSHYLGREVRYGTWWPDRQLRLFDRRRFRTVGREPHPKIEVDDEVGRLNGPLAHFPYRTFAAHLATIERYTTIMAEELHAAGKRASTWNLIVNPAVRFLRFYVTGRGVLHGWRGLLLSLLAAHYVRLKYAKLLVLQRADD